MLKDLLKQNRSFRRFDESVRISEDDLRNWVEAVRYVPSTANSQALKYRLVCDEDGCAKTFATLGWAAYLTDWQGPAEGERPTAYVVVLCDRTIAKAKPIDDGICAFTISLAASEAGYGGCILANVKKAELAAALGIDTERFEIDLVIALGKPAETVKLVDATDDIRYYRDENDDHVVPKRPLDELLV